jgi:deoxycytidine triphosphate deaminase
MWLIKRGAQARENRRSAMLLNGDDIRTRGLVRNFDPKMFKAASYNPRIAKILTSKGDELTSYVLPPQGTVEVVSIEEFTLPTEVAGYATVKTSLCNNGILAINIGIIDPLWKGPISSTLINFGKNAYLLQAEAEFLRVTFHEYEPQKTPPQPSAIILSYKDYVADRKQKVLQHLSDTFLDVDKKTREITQSVASEVLREWRHELFRWVPLTVFALAILTFFLNFGNAWVGSRNAQDGFRNEINGKIEAEDKANEEFRRRIEQQMQDFSKQVQSTKATQTTPEAKAKP